MSVNQDELEQTVLSALNERTLVNGTAVPTTPIAREVGISADELERALTGLVEKGWIRRAPGELATMTPEGHAHQM
jgi:DNA-binding IclR family transcriptional regulator